MWQLLRKQLPVLEKMLLQQLWRMLQLWQLLRKQLLMKMLAGAENVAIGAAPEEAAEETFEEADDVANDEETAADEDAVVGVAEDAVIAAPEVDAEEGAARAAAVVA